MKIKSPGILACAGFVALLLISAPALAVDAVAPPLGTAKQFGALGHSGVTGATGTGVVVVSGDVGSSPTPTIINFPPSRTVPPYIVHYANDGVVAQAHLDAIAAYTALAGQGAGTVLDDDLTGATITPGVYSFTLGHPILPDGTTLTLNDPTGTGIFVFNVATTLTGVVNSHVVGTANPCNIYWRVGSSATLNGATFRGIVIAYASITLGSGANLAGQALATTGAVTMAGSGGNTISGCTVLPTSPCPTITIAPPTLPIGKIGVAYSQQLTASGGTGSYTFSVVSGTLPAGLTLSSDGLLAGTPTTVGSPPVTIAAIDGNGCPGVIPFVMAPSANCLVIAFSPPTLPIGKVGVPYSRQITASGGTGSYTFSVVSGTLPAGLTLSSDGLLAGTPTTVGSPPVTILATDGNGCPGDILFVIAGADASIPTLSGWGLMTLMVLIGVASIYRLRRI